MDHPRMSTLPARKLLDEAHAVLLFLDDKDITEQVEWNGHTTTPAMLLALAQNRLRLAAERCDQTRLTHFGFPESGG